LAELEQWHSSARYLADNAANSDQCPMVLPSEPCNETETDAYVDSELRKAAHADATTSLSTQDGHATKLDMSCTFDASRMTYDIDCRDCQFPVRSPRPDELVMYLHAYRYQVAFFDFSYTSQHLIDLTATLCSCHILIITIQMFVKCIVFVLLGRMRCRVADCCN